MTLGVLLTHVAARWAATRTPTCGWVPDESETEMTETPAQPTAVPLDNLARLMLQQITEHQRARPFDPDNVGEPPQYEVARMDEWQRTDSAMRLVLGSALTRDAIRTWQEATS